MAANSDLEARVMAIAEELRCLVCQNETIAASRADLAVDLRKQIALKLAAGQSKEEIIDFMVARYGDFVLYRPPLRAATALLWTGPLLLALAGLAVAWRSLGRAGRIAPTPPSSASSAALDDADDGAGPDRPDWLDDAAPSEPRRTRT